MSIGALIAAIVIALFVLGAIVWIIHDALEAVTDFIKWLGKLTDVLGGVLPGLTRAQKFNIIVDVVFAIACVLYAYALVDDPRYVLITFVILTSIIVICLLIAFREKKRSP